MSELKEHLFVPYSELQEGDELTDAITIAKSYYLKSEADRVIAYRDCEIKKLKDSLNKLLKAKTEQIMQEVIQKALIYCDGFVPVEHAIKLVAEIRHNKYKRCLAMAKWCHNQREIYERDSYDWELEDDAVNSLRNKADIMRKWRKRCLELAEKFKELKNAED